MYLLLVSHFLCDLFFFNTDNQVGPDIFCIVMQGSKTCPPWIYHPSLKQNESHSACAESTHKGVKSFEDVALVEFMYLVFTCITGESYCSHSGLCCCAVTSFKCWLTPLCTYRPSLSARQEWVRPNPGSCCQKDQHICKSDWKLWSHFFLSLSGIHLHFFLLRQNWKPTHFFSSAYCTVIFFLLILPTHH